MAKRSPVVVEASPAKKHRADLGRPSSATSDDLAVSDSQHDRANDRDAKKHKSKNSSNRIEATKSKKQSEGQEVGAKDNSRSASDQAKVAKDGANVAEVKRSRSDDERREKKGRSDDKRHEKKGRSDDERREKKGRSDKRSPENDAGSARRKDREVTKSGRKRKSREESPEKSAVVQVGSIKVKAVSAKAEEKPEQKAPSAFDAEREFFSTYIGTMKELLEAEEDSLDLILGFLDGSASFYRPRVADFACHQSASRGLDWCLDCVSKCADLVLREESLAAMRDAEKIGEALKMIFSTLQIFFQRLEGKWLRTSKNQYGSRTLERLIQTALKCVFVFGASFEADAQKPLPNISEFRGTIQAALVGAVRELLEDLPGCQASNSASCVLRAGCNALAGVFASKPKAGGSQQKSEPWKPRTDTKGQFVAKDPLKRFTYALQGYCLQPASATTCFIFLCPEAEYLCQRTAELLSQFDAHQLMSTYRSAHSAITFQHILSLVPHTSYDASIWLKPFQHAQFKDVILKAEPQARVLEFIYGQLVDIKVLCQELEGLVKGCDDDRVLHICRNMVATAVGRSRNADEIRQLLITPLRSIDGACLSGSSAWSRKFVLGLCEILKVIQMVGCKQASEEAIEAISELYSGPFWYSILCGRTKKCPSQSDLQADSVGFDLAAELIKVLRSVPPEAAQKYRQSLKEFLADGKLSGLMKATKLGHMSRFLEAAMGALPASTFEPILIPSAGKASTGKHAPDTAIICHWALNECGSFVVAAWWHHTQSPTKRKAILDALKPVLQAIRKKNPTLYSILHKT